LSALLQPSQAFGMNEKRYRREKSRIEGRLNIIRDVAMQWRLETETGIISLGVNVMQP
jgi:hypothetical protein